jgi:hypothetical protein
MINPKECKERKKITGRKKKGIFFSWANPKVIMKACLCCNQKRK